MFYSTKAKKKGDYPSTSSDLLDQCLLLKCTKRKIQWHVYIPLLSSPQKRSVDFGKDIGYQNWHWEEHSEAICPWEFRKALLSIILSAPNTREKIQYDAPYMGIQAALFGPRTHSLRAVVWYRTLPAMVCLRTEIENLQFQ